MKSLLLFVRSGFVVVAAAALAVGGALMGASSASAADLDPAAVSATGVQSGVRSVTLAADLTPQSDQLRVTSPASNSTSPSRTITYSGTAPAGSTVHIDTNATAYYRPDVTVDASGVWAITTTFETGTPQNTVLATASATFSGQDANGITFVPQSVTDIALPSPAAAPIITAVSTDGPTVTVTGAGAGGPAVAIFFSAVDAAAQAAANNMPGSIEATGVVGATGTFSATTTLAVGQWSASAVLLATTDVHTADYLSLRSADHPFTVTAASVPVVPATTVQLDPASTADTAELADTGSSAIGALLASSFLLLAGLALVTSRRWLVTRR